MKDLQKVVFDALSVDNTDMKREYNDALRGKILEVLGTEEWNYYNFMENKYKVFAIMAEMFPVMTKSSLAGKFDRFADFHDVEVGDSKYFVVEDNNIYSTVTTSRGNADVDRQKITDKKFNIPTAVESIKLYDELDRFMKGEITVERMTTKAVDAHANSIALKISDAIYNSYSAVGTPFKATGAFDSAVLNSIIENVKAATGASRVQIFGTSTALANISDVAGYSDEEKMMFNGIGYYGSFRGHDLVALPQAYRPNTESNTFVVDNDFLLILPADEKIVKVIFEGEVWIDSVDSKIRSDKQLEIQYDRNVGVGAITAVDGKYGIYKLS